MKRRDFLRSSIIAAGSLALGPLTSLARVGDKPRQILVIGGGLSGLVAAYELSKLGHNVIVIEAQARCGGRVHTLREFPEGQYADQGAARIPNDHDLTLKYVAEFSLPLIPFYPTENKFSRFNNGTSEEVDWDGFAQATAAVMGLERPDHWRKIKGGNDLLPRAFTEKLGKRIRYNSPVLKIDQNEKNVSVTFDEKGKRQSLTGDLLVCAVPATMLRNIEISPKFSDARAKIINEARYDSASRVFVQTKDRFWLKKKLNGFAFGENFTEVWDSTFGEPGAHGILHSYTRYNISSALTQMSQADRVESTVKSLEKLFPDLRGHVEKGYSKCWSEDPWVKGAWGSLRFDQMPILMKPDNRIFFAGEHISSHGSWMQGAFQSGLRVVQEISQSTLD